VQVKLMQVFRYTRYEGVWESEVIAPVILNLSTVWRCVVRLTPRPFFIQEGARKYPFYRLVFWAPDVVWTCWRREKYFGPAGSEPLLFCLLSGHSTDCLILTPAFCKVENFICIFILIGNIKALISTANLLHGI